MVIINYPVSQQNSLYQIFSFSIPVSWSNGTDRMVNVSIPIGFMMSGVKLNPSDVYTLSNCNKPTTLTINKNGSFYCNLTGSFNSYGGMSISFGSTSTKTFNVGSGTSFSFYSYFYTININFTPPVASGSADTYVIYAPIIYTINCANYTSGELLPANYGLCINSTSSLSAFTNASYSSGSHDESGIAPYYYSVYDYYTAPTIRNNTGYLNLSRGYFTNGLNCYGTTNLNNLSLSGTVTGLTVADSSLSSNIPLLNASNTYAALNTFF